MNKKTSQFLLALAVAGIPVIANADAGAANANAGATEIDYIGREWYQRINLSGFGAVGYVNTDDESADSKGSFEVQEAKLFLEANVSDDISFFYEMDLVTEGNAGVGRVSSNEAYVNMNSVMGDDSFALRVGRMDIPFGEEYTMEDSIDNPLIDHSVNHPNGNSEGIMAYGSFSDVSWKLALMNGNSDRGQDENSNKSLNAKLAYNISSDLYVSVSYAHNKSADSAATYGGNSVASATAVDSDAVGIDAKWNFDGKSNLWLAYGMVSVDSTPDSDVTFFTVQPTYYVSDDVYLVARYSGFGTYDSDEGYSAAAALYGNGADFGANLESVERIQLGLGYMIKPNVIAKVEYHRDSFEELVDSNLDDSRDFYGAQVVVRF